jgi:alpha-tubulin suppressor-like RCC1 family protein
MIRRTILRSAPLMLAAATLLSACSELPSDPGIRSPGGPLLTVTPTNAFVQIDGGPTHACAVTSGGQAYCWGRNPFGELGDGSYSNSSVPVAVLQFSLSFSQVTSGLAHTCAIATSSGAPYCWGHNADGRVGDSTAMNIRPTPVAVYGNHSFTSISAGEAHTCGLTSAGQAYCWGANNYGQLGNNTATFSRIPVAVQQPVGVTFSQITAGKWHTCGLSSGQAYCWGYGAAGQLGYGFTFGDSIPAAVDQPAGVTFTTINTGYDHTCGLTSGGIAYCWGENGNAQLGDSTTTDRYTPVESRRPASVTYSGIATAGFSTCAISSTNTAAYCWGLGSSGQLGNGSTANSRLPVAVSMPSGVSFYSISAESTGMCALDGVGQTWCWGKNLYGQLGDNSTTDRSTPVAVVH